MVPEIYVRSSTVIASKFLELYVQVDTFEKKPSEIKKKIRE